MRSSNLRDWLADQLITPPVKAEGAAKVRLRLLGLRRNAHTLPEEADADKLLATVTDPDFYDKIDDINGEKARIEWLDGAGSSIASVRYSPIRRKSKMISSQPEIISVPAPETKQSGMEGAARLAASGGQVELAAALAMITNSNNTLLEALQGERQQVRELTTLVKDLAVAVVTNNNRTVESVVKANVAGKEMVAEMFVHTLGQKDQALEEKHAAEIALKEEEANKKPPTKADEIKAYVDVFKEAKTLIGEKAETALARVVKEAGQGKMSPKVKKTIKAMSAEERARAMQVLAEMLQEDEQAA